MRICRQFRMNLWAIQNEFVGNSEWICRQFRNLRQGWVLFKRTCEFSGIQFTKHFIEFVFVETNQVVRSNSNVILTRQTYGHPSSRVAGSKSRALAFCFSIRIWYMFFMSICRGKSYLGVCMTSVLAQRMRPHGADFRFKIVFGCRIRRLSVCERITHMNDSSYEWSLYTNKACRISWDMPCSYSIYEHICDINGY